MYKDARGEGNSVCTRPPSRAWEMTAEEGGWPEPGGDTGGQGRGTDCLQSWARLKGSHVLPVEPVLVSLLQLPDALNAL